jgi:hypothetical protein
VPGQVNHYLFKDPKLYKGQFEVTLFKNTQELEPLSKMDGVTLHSKKATGTYAKDDDYDLFV